MRFSAAVFDLDGTLLDTLADIADAANCVLEQHNLPTFDYDAYRYFVGEGVSKLFARAIGDQRCDDELIASCVSGFRDTYSRAWNQKSLPYAGIREMLSALNDRHLKLAVLSNKPHQFTACCIEHFLDGYGFEPVLGQREGIPHKPDPAGAMEIAGYWGIPTDRCLYVGDTSIDMQTAKNANMTPIGVAWGFRPREEMMEHGAKLVIEHPNDLIAIVDGEMAL